MPNIKDIVECVRTKMEHEHECFYFLKTETGCPFTHDLGKDISCFKNSYNL